MIENNVLFITLLCCYLFFISDIEPTQIDHIPIQITSAALSSTPSTVYLAPSVPESKTVYVPKTKISPPMNTFVNGWRLVPPYIDFYFQRFCDPNEKYLRDFHEDPKKCGCENVACVDEFIKKSKNYCGYCGKTISAWCCQDDGIIGCCRRCFIFIFCTHTIQLRNGSVIVVPTQSREPSPFDMKRVRELSATPEGNNPKRSRLGDSPINTRYANCV